MIVYDRDNLVCERFQLGALEVNTYLLYEKNGVSAILVDPADNSKTILETIERLNISQLTIFLTHGHADHIGGCNFFRKNLKNCSLTISEADSPMLADAELNLSAFLGDPLAVQKADAFLKEGDRLETGSHIGQVFEIPGHTPGGLILAFPQMVFTGDTLFAGSVGRSDFPGGDGKLLLDSIVKKIFSLPDRLVLPGHGAESTIEAEKKTNPFFANFFRL